MFPVFFSGMALSMSLIMAIGPQNAHVLRMGLSRQHVLLTIVVCALGDMAMILAGVYGLSQLGQLSDKLFGALLGAGTLFLSVYGWRAFARFWHQWQQRYAHDASDAVHAAAPPSYSRSQAVGAALAFSLLNPHAWLDTAALIGTASLAYGQAAGIFGWGAITGSAVWFALLGVLAYFLGRHLRSKQIWMWLDLLVAIMMWVIAFYLARSLLVSS